MLGKPHITLDWCRTEEVLIRPRMDASVYMELLFYLCKLWPEFAPCFTGNYRKNSVQSRKVVLWIHISSVGQWSSCMWHNICWHIGYSFCFFLSIQVTSGKGSVVSQRPWGSHFSTSNYSFLFYNFPALSLGDSIVCSCSGLLRIHLTDFL